MPLPPLIHTVCGGPAGPRLVIADDGDPAYIAWCSTCDRPLDGDEGSRPLAVEDITAEQAQALAMAATKGTVQ